VQQSARPAVAERVSPVLALPAVPAKSSRGLVLLTVALSLLAVVLLLFKFWPRNGELTVTVSGPNRAPVDMLEIRVDDRTVCKQSPCAVTKLAVGAHTVDVTAPGYVKSATRAAEIEYGQTAQVEFSLTPGTTGVRVGALGPNLRLFVDGNDRGPLPASLDDLTPGPHSMRIEGSDRFKPFEQQFTLGPGEIKTLEPKLKVAKGLAKLEPGENAKGARVWLTCSNDPKVELALPTVKEVAVDKGCRVEASKRGFENTSLDLNFEDGSVEKSFSVDLAQKVAAAPAPPPVAYVSRVKSAPKPAVEKPAPKPVAEKPAPKPAVEKPAPAPKPAGPTGTININSMPVSSVTVDGTPAGQTPAHVNVPAGNHTVVFTHPEKGRKSVTVKVKAGATTSAVVRFD
jgi:serine/threonine-protein kinase